MTFEVELGPNGKKRAHSVQYPVRGRARMPQRSEAPADWTLPRLLAIPAFIAIYYYVASRWPVQPVVIAIYVLASLVAFLAYALDKSAAIQKRWRTSEGTLLLIGLACGWPGALLAQQFLRHKSSKPSFVAAFWMTVLLNVAGFVAVHAGALSLARL